MLSLRSISARTSILSGSLARRECCTKSSRTNSARWDDLKDRLHDFLRKRAPGRGAGERDRLESRGYAGDDLVLAIPENEDEAVGQLNAGAGYHVFVSPLELFRQVVHLRGSLRNDLPHREVFSFRVFHRPQFDPTLPIQI